MDSPHLEQYSLEGSSFFPFSFFATPIVISSSIYATALRAEFYIFLKKQFTPPPLRAALGGTGGSVNCFFLARRAFF